MFIFTQQISKEAYFWVKSQDNHPLKISTTTHFKYIEELCTPIKKRIRRKKLCFELKKANNKTKKGILMHWSRLMKFRRNIWSTSSTWIQLWSVHRDPARHHNSRALHVPHAFPKPKAWIAESFWEQVSTRQNHFLTDHSASRQNQPVLLNGYSTGHRQSLCS